MGGQFKAIIHQIKDGNRQKEFCMKNLFKTRIASTLGIIALVAVIAILAAACTDPDQTEATFTSYDANGNSYTLVITKAADRAAYVPQSGDTYVLTVKNTAGTVIASSTGTVTAVSGSSFTLTPGSGSPITITISGDTIGTITGTIPGTGSNSDFYNPVVSKDKPSDGDGEHYSKPIDQGTFTVTGIPDKYNGKYAGFSGYNDDADFYGCQNNPKDDPITLVKIANGSVRLPMWVTDKLYEYVEYYGFDTVDTGNIFIIDSQYPNDDDYSNPTAGIYWEQITFSNGSATKTWSSGTVTVTKD